MILDADSFDHYGTSVANMTDGAWAEVGLGWSLDTTHPRTGAFAMKSIAQNPGDLRKVFGAAYGRAGVGMAVYFTALPPTNGQRQIIAFRDGANRTQIAICVQSTGAIAIYRGSGGGVLLEASPLATSSLLLTANGLNHLEAWVDVDATDGACEVRLNEATAVAISGENTDPNGTSETSQWASTATGALGAAYNVWIDDMIQAEGDSSDTFNSDFVGDRKVFTQFPDLDVSSSADPWAPSAGTDLFAMIAEADPDGDGTFDEAAVAGEVLEVGFPDLPTEVVAVQGLVMLHKTKKTDAGSCDVQLAVESAGSESLGTDRPMTAAYTLYHDVFEADPDTGMPWTRAAVNAMSVKLTRTT